MPIFVFKPTASEHHTAGIGATPSFPVVDADAFVHSRHAAGVGTTKSRPYFLRRLAAFVEAHFFERGPLARLAPNHHSPRVHDLRLA